MEGAGAVAADESMDQPQRYSLLKMWLRGTVVGDVASNGGGCWMAVLLPLQATPQGALANCCREASTVQSFGPGASLLL